MNNNAFFHSAIRIQVLMTAAKRWEGTPFVANACVLGSGVSCQKLAARLLIEAGHLPADFTAPDGPMDWGKANTRSLIAEFLDQQTKYFRQVDLNERGLVPAWGDVVGFQIGGCVQHLGVVLKVNPVRFMSALEDGAQERRLDDASWLTRLKRIWRPIEA